MIEAEIYRTLADLYGRLAASKEADVQSPTLAPSILPSVQRRLAQSFAWLSMQVQPLAVVPKAGDTVYLLKDFWTTAYGSWERGQNPDKSQVEVEPWARNDYLKPFGAPDYFDEAGADHHLFGAVIGLDGKLKPNLPFRFWTPAYNGNESNTTTKAKSGWCNVAVSADAAFRVADKQVGPWAWRPDLPLAEAIVGGGMPEVGDGKWHVSFFAVWVEVKIP